MKFKKEIFDGLSASLVLMNDETLPKYNKALTELRDCLNDANSAFPATKAFLQARGLSNVSQLDKQGLVELTKHLENTLSATIFPRKETHH